MASPNRDVIPKKRVTILWQLFFLPPSLTTGFHKGGFAYLLNIFCKSDDSYYLCACYEYVRGALVPLIFSLYIW